MQHIIKKQVIELTIDKKIDAFRLQHEVSRHYWDKVVPELEKAFDAASSSDEVIQLDKLEIDLGVISLKDIEKGRWSAMVSAKIAEQFISIKHEAATKEGVKIQSQPLSIVAQWIYYMQHGYLPWNVLQTNETWYEYVLEAFAADAVAINLLRSLIKGSSNTVKRIILQHNEQFIATLVETLTAEKQDTLPQIIDQTAEGIVFFNQEKENKTLLQKKELKEKLWQQVLQLTASDEKSFTSAKIALHLLSKNIEDEQLLEKLQPELLSKFKITAATLEQIKNENKKKLHADEIEIRNTTTADNAQETIEGIYVQHAGIVLLHPFLNMFFKNLSFIKEGKFVDTASHQKALCLLHYLATGNTKPQEHELVIPKVLCAYPFEEPADSNIELAENELREANNLLVNAIQQWEILKNTSPDGLRESFLQRNGKLYTKNDNLHLQVESSSIDVLLDQLPQGWNLSLVKLPWMENMLSVEWR